MRWIVTDEAKKAKEAKQATTATPTAEEVVVRSVVETLGLV